jgi:hypothetical protein
MISLLLNMPFKFTGSLSRLARDKAIISSQSHRTIVPKSDYEKRGIIITTHTPLPNITILQRFYLIFILIVMGFRIYIGNGMKNDVLYGGKMLSSF